MLARLGMQDLEQVVDELGRESRDTHLLLDLKDRDPDDAATKLAYEKGYFLLRLIEETVGRAAFEKVEEQVRAFERGAPIETANWSTHEWIHFLRHLPKPLTREQMAKLDADFDFHFTD